MVIYLDGPSFSEMGLYPDVHGYTTNPTLIKKAGVTGYKDYIIAMLGYSCGKPVSFEVLADDWVEMEEQARWLSAFGSNVYVKIPVTNTKGESSLHLITKLSESIKLNVTAIMTMEQVRSVARSLNPSMPAVISIFAGRVNDTGRSVEGLFTAARHVKHDLTKILWASTRQIYSATEADRLCDIITLPAEMYRKLMMLHSKDLKQYSLETVKQFYEDGKGIEI